MALYARGVFDTNANAVRRAAHQRVSAIEALRTELAVAVIHGVGLIMLLGLMGYVTLFNDFGLGSK